MASAPPTGRPAWVQVDLDALSRNLERLSEHVAPARTLAVVKADAYGHGASEVALRLDRDGVAALGVAFAAEGVALRRAGVGSPILVLGPTHADEPTVYFEQQLTPTISDLPRLRVWEEWLAGRRVEQQVHLKVDTGMSRLGLDATELSAALELVRSSRWLSLSGLMSHLAEADEPSSAANEQQRRRFVELVNLLTPEERQRVAIHLSNSAGALYLEPIDGDLVRAGLALYGVAPAPGATCPIPLEPVMRVEAEVVALRDVSPGTRVGYGGTWTARTLSRLALVPVGYGDGYPWRHATHGEVLIGGRRAPLAGRISMDMLSVDVTNLPVSVGDSAVLLGSQGDQTIDAWEIASGSGTIAWETLCQFGLRLPRRYISGSEPVTRRNASR